MGVQSSKNLSGISKTSDICNEMDTFVNLNNVHC